MRTFQNGPNELHSFFGSKNIESPRFHEIYFVQKQLLKSIKPRNVPSTAFPLLLMLFQNMPIFWCRNISYTRCKMLLLIGENMRKYAGFYQGLRPKKSLASIFKVIVAWK